MLIHGDAIQELHRIRKYSAQSVIADPPYFNVLNVAWDKQWQTEEDYLDWTMEWITLSMRALKEDGLLFCFGQTGKREHVFFHVISESSRRFQFHDLIIWDRIVGYNERRDSFTPAYEMILVLRKQDKVKFNKDAIRIPYNEETIQQYMKDKRYKDKQARLNHLKKGKFATNILRTPSLKGSSKQKCGHPSQKPIELISQLILSSTDKGDLVLDPFMGSGTSAVAAEQLGRKWIGIESDKKFADMTEARLQQERSLFSLAG